MSSMLDWKKYGIEWDKYGVDWENVPDRFKNKLKFLRSAQEAKSPLQPQPKPPVVIHQGRARTVGKVLKFLGLGLLVVVTTLVYNSSAMALFITHRLAPLPSHVPRPGSTANYNPTAAQIYDFEEMRAMLSNASARNQQMEELLADDVWSVLETQYNASFVAREPLLHETQELEPKLLKAGVLIDRMLNAHEAYLSSFSKLANGTQRELDLLWRYEALRFPSAYIYNSVAPRFGLHEQHHNQSLYRQSLCTFFAQNDYLILDGVQSASMDAVFKAEAYIIPDNVSSLKSYASQKFKKDRMKPISYPQYVKSALHTATTAADDRLAIHDHFNKVKRELLLLAADQARHMRFLRWVHVQYLPRFREVRGVFKRQAENWACVGSGSESGGAQEMKFVEWMVKGRDGRMIVVLSRDVVGVLLGEA